MMRRLQILAALLPVPWSAQPQLRGAAALSDAANSWTEEEVFTDVEMVPLALAQHQQQRRAAIMAPAGGIGNENSSQNSKRKRKTKKQQPQQAQEDEVAARDDPWAALTDAAAAADDGTSTAPPSSAVAEYYPSATATISSLFYATGVSDSLPRVHIPTAATTMAASATPTPITYSPTSPAAGDAPPAVPPAIERYETRVREFFVNPFNGKQTSIHSPVTREFEALGFRRDQANLLHLDWSPETYFRQFHRTLAGIQQAHNRRVKKLRLERALRQRRREAARKKSKMDPTTAAEWEEEDGDDDDDAGEEEAPRSMDDISTEEVLSVLLRSFEGSGSGATPEWRKQLAQLMRRHDALTAIPLDLKERYASLTSAHMPPKLDATPDPAVADIGLTTDQENVSQLALRGYHLYIGGSAGTGKTVLLKSIYRALSQRGLRVAMTATTGVAAVQLGGCTFHRAFNVPMDDWVARGKPAWDAPAMRAVDVVIIDEVSLLSAQTLDAFDMEARLARMQYTPFGGIQVIACGDFLQLAGGATVDALPCYQSEAFRNLLLLQLVTPMRHVEGDPLIKLLRQLRRGQCDEGLMALLNRPLPPDATEVTYIFPRRREAQVLNDEKLSELLTAEMLCAPQRGPLELVGTFTHSALLTFDDPEALPLPPREEIVAVVRAEVAAVLAALEATEEKEERQRLMEKGGADPTAVPAPRPYAYKEIAEFDVVIMPTRTTLPGITLRLRSFTDPREEAVRREALRHARLLGSGGGRGGAPAFAFLTKTITTTPIVPLLSPAAAAPPRPTALRSATAHMVAQPADWARVAAAVAARLKGRLVSMFESEPPELVPLSVSTLLADAANGGGEVAEGLQPLRLKLGCRVMVNRNLSRTVSNGSVGVVEAFAPADPKLFPGQGEGLVRCQRVSGVNRMFPQLPVVRLLSGEVVQIPPTAAMLGGTPATFYYGHEVFALPLQLGYGFTVHKVQGLTLQGTVVLDCKHFFECPHLIYVACSRVRSLEQLIVWNAKSDMVMARKSALDFSDSVQEAKDALVLSVPPDVPRAAWALNASPRIYTM